MFCVLLVLFICCHYYYDYDCYDYYDYDYSDYDSDYCCYYVVVVSYNAVVSVATSCLCCRSAES